MSPVDPDPGIAGTTGTTQVHHFQPSKEATEHVIDETLFEAEEKMERAIEFAKEEFAAIRTGRATPGMFSRIVIDYYGAPTPLPNMASIAIPEPRMVIIKPHDPSQMKAMEKAIRDSDLGVNPNNEGTQIRIIVPQMTEERRRDMIKVARHKGEESKVAIRNVRRKAKEELDRIVKDGEAGEDDGRRAEKELEDLTHRFVAHVDELLKHKEAELLEV
jgi:ribosome recycling factor